MRPVGCYFNKTSIKLYYFLEKSPLLFLLDEVAKKKDIQRSFMNRCSLLCNQNRVRLLNLVLLWSKFAFLPGKDTASWCDCLELPCRTEPPLWQQSVFCDYAPSTIETPSSLYCLMSCTEISNLKQLGLNMFLKILPSNLCHEHLCKS